MLHWQLHFTYIPYVYTRIMYFTFNYSRTNVRLAFSMFTHSYRHDEFNQPPLIPICCLIRASTLPAMAEARAVASPFHDRVTLDTKANNFNEVHSSCSSALFRGTSNIHAWRSNGLIFWELVSIFKKDCTS